MKWKSLKRGLAVVLSALMITSSVSVYAEEPQSTPAQTDSTVESTQDGESEPSENAMPPEEPNPEEGAGAGADVTPSEKPNPEEAGADADVTPSEKPDPKEEAGADVTPSKKPDPKEEAGADVTPSEKPDLEEEAGADVMPSEDSQPEEGVDPGKDTTSSEDSQPEEGVDPGENGKPSETQPTTETETTVEEPTESETEIETETETETETEPQEIIAFADIQDIVTFNTGNLEISVIPSDDYSDELFETCLEDNIYIAPFNEDGSFTIEAEADAFFPYEVQFQYDGTTESRWFLSPDDRCSVNGHMFDIHSEFSGNVITQMSLGVAGKTITVYPEKKEFTNDGGISTYSLLPLEERELTIDLRGLTPVELTMVSMSACAGNDQIKDTDDIVWKLLNDSHDDYQVSVSDGRVDLSCSTYIKDNVLWEVITGKADQLAADNIRYLITVQVTESMNWLTPVIYCLDASGNRKEVKVVETSYSDWKSNTNQFENAHYDKQRYYLYITPAANDIGDAEKIYVGLTINPNVFASTQYSRMDVYGKLYKSISELENDSQSDSYRYGNFFDTDMTQQEAGLCLPWQKKDTETIGSVTGKNFTLVTYDNSGTATGCLPIEMNLYDYSVGFDYDLYGENYELKSTMSSIRISGKYQNHNLILEPGNAAGNRYRLVLYYTEDMTQHNEKVTAAYIGDYASIAEAEAAGSVNIKDQLFGLDGYSADYSGNGILFSIFIGEDSSENQRKYYHRFRTEEGQYTDAVLTDPRTYVRFNGLKDAAQQDIPCYCVDVLEDSYAEYNYLTMIVGKDVDLTNVAPTFVTAEGIRLYSGAEGQESGKTYHNFANGSVQYTAASSDGTRQKNYWLQIVKAEDGQKLYVNSLADPGSNTVSAGGLTTTTREVFLDTAHDQIHDILLVNMGTSPIEKISVELQSDWLELDSYWQLKGDYDLSGFTTTQKAEHGELPNMAKIRLKMKDRNIPTGTGTLIIKSNGNAIMQLNLTGTEAKAHITTEQADIDKVLAVKYVPYGLMIQNDNKYGLNQTSYTLKSGNLPKGMNLRTNGELYGVPQEAGTFTFCVHMANSSSTQSDEKEFTLTIQENTDENIEKATDEEYVILDKMPDVGSPALYDKVFRSKGEFRYFDGDGAVYIDGRKLIRDVEYTASDGSTRIVIRAETLDKLEDGWHTLGVEFRNDNRELKRVAQNFRKGRDVVETPPPDEDKNTPSDSGGRTSSSDNTAAVLQPPVPVQPLKMPPVFVDMDGNVIRGWAEAVFAGYQEALAAWLAAGGTGRMTISINAIGATDLIIPEAVVRLMAETGADYYIFLDNMVVILTSENLRLIEGEIDLNFALNRVRDFGEGFDALILDTGGKNKWYSPIFVHLVLDQAKAGQTAYLFAASESGGYELVDIQTIGSNGTICLDIAQYASTIVLY